MTDSPAPLRSLNCPNCGAPLDIPQARASVTCRFCGSVVERSDDEPTPDDESHALKIDLREGRITVEGAGSGTVSARRYVIKMQSGQPMVIDTGQVARPPTVSDVAAANVPTPARPKHRAANIRGSLSTLFFLVLTAIPIIIILMTMPGVGSVFSSLLSGNVQETVSNIQNLGVNISVKRSAALVPAADDAPPEILLLTNQRPLDGGAAASRVVALSGTSPQLLWQSESLGSVLCQRQDAFRRRRRHGRVERIAHRQRLWLHTAGSL
ncbi:MAG: TFIIB-type zinc ribbon-containing protein [Anaerolineales bacterium]|nr:TFIIB-type zinc ribbon-containing protein [Anaerolineales bacterium]